MRNYTRWRNEDPSPEWRIFDAQIIRQAADDLVLIEQHGRVEEFLLHVGAAMRNEFGDTAGGDAFEAAEFAQYGLSPLPGESLAHKIFGVSDSTINATLAWHHHRRRLRFAARLVREEAARVRESLDRRMVAGRERVA